MCIYLKCTMLLSWLYLSQESVQMWHLLYFNISVFGQQKISNVTLSIYKKKLEIKCKLYIFWSLSGNVCKQESIPVGCVPPALYHTGGSSWQRLPWTETPLNRDPLDRDPLDRDPLDRDPSLWTESQTGVKTLPSRNFVCGW